MISVITVCYNASHYIEPTVTSVVSQTASDFEFIVVDGKSTDNTVPLVHNIIKETGFQSNKFKCISEHDNGVYDAMNKGVKLAQGEYIIFMNGGDSFYDNHVIEKLNQLTTDSNYDAYYGNTLMYFYEGKGILHDNEEINRNPVMPFIHQSVIVRRSLLLEHPFDTRYKILADYEFFYWMRKTKRSFHYEDFIVSFYDAREGLSENNPYQIALERDQILERDLEPLYWIRRIKLSCTKRLIQPIKDFAPRILLNWYFRKTKTHIEWL